MRGDQDDFISRLRLTLPEGWFGDGAPILTGLLAGLGSAWAGLYDLLGAVRLQARLATATGQFLDLACVDYFGGGVVRRVGESDAALRARLAVAMRRLRATRQSVIDAAGVAGYSAGVFEPARPADTGAYSTPGGLAWGVAGGWGSLQMPLECLVTMHPTGAVADPFGAIAEALPAGGVAWTRISQ